MKYVLTALALVVLCVPAFAGGNPDIRLYISFDQTGAGGEVYSTGPLAPFEGFTAYLCASNIGTGFTGVSFRLTDVEAMFPGQFFAPVTFVPSPQFNSNAITASGISLATGTCQTADPTILGTMSLATGVGGQEFCIEIMDQPTFPRWVVDCTQPNGLVDFYCIMAHGTVGGAVCPDFECDDAVEVGTWGSIKALYR